MKSSRTCPQWKPLCGLLVSISFILSGCSGNDPVQSNIPIIAVNPSSLDFIAPFGLSSAQDSLIVSNVGGDSLVFDASTTASWISIEGQSPTRIFVRANSLGLPVGVVTDRITIRSSNASNSPVHVPVSLTVLNRFLLSDTVVTFAGITGSTNPSPVTITLDAGGGVPEGYTASWKASWLTVSPASGMTPQQITFAPVVAGLPGRLFTDTVTFTSTAMPALSRTVVVKLSLSSWTVGTLPLAVDVQGVDFLDNNNGWAAGFLGGGSGTSGTLLRTIDGGLSWTIGGIFDGGGFGEVGFADSVNGVVAGDSARIYRTTDGGTSWSQIPRQNLPVDSSVDLWRVSFVNNTTGFIIGTSGTILRTLNGGASWTRQNSNTSFSLGGMSFVTANEGWIVGNAGTILHTTNTGITWTAQTSGSNTDFWGVSFIDPSKGWIVGSSGRILSTDDGGLNWNVVQSPVSELLRNITFVGSDLGWAVGQNGVLIHTSDGGASWLVQATGVTAQLFGLFFFDSKVGVISGGDGTILKTLNGGF